MKDLFQQDSVLIGFLNKVADLMILNLVFIGVSLPVVTLGASITALNYTAMKLAAGECESVTGSFLKSFRENVRQATLLGLIVAGFSLVLVAWFVAVQRVAMPVPLEVVLMVLLGLVSFRFALTVLYVFAYHARFEGGIREVLNTSRRLSARHLLSSVLLLLVTGLPVVVTVFYPQAVAYGLLWFVFGFALVAYVDAHVFNNVFAKYIPAE